MESVVRVNVCMDFISSCVIDKSAFKHILVTGASQIKLQIPANLNSQCEVCTF